MWEILKSLNEINKIVKICENLLDIDVEGKNEGVNKNNIATLIIESKM